MRRILWVDDCESLTGYVTAFLPAKGFEVHIAHTAAAGAHAVSRSTFDLIVIDLVLPDISGLELLRWVRGSGVTTPVLIVTGMGTTTSALEAGRLGVVGFEAKPLHGRQLLAAIRQGLDGRGERPVLPLQVAVPTGPTLALTLASPTTSFPEFLHAADTLKAVATSSAGGRTTPRIPAPPLDVRVQRVVQRLEDAGPRWTSLTAARMATFEDLHPATLWRLMHTHLGRGFPECRRAIVVRSGIRLLAQSSEHVRQIAYQIGYEHSSQFVRHCRHVIGLSPNGYRRLHDGSRTPN